MTDSEIKTSAKEERKRIKALLKDAGISERSMDESQVRRCKGTNKKYQRSY